MNGKTSIDDKVNHLKFRWRDLIPIYGYIKFAQDDVNSKPEWNSIEELNKNSIKKTLKLIGMATYHIGTPTYLIGKYGQDIAEHVKNLF